MDYPGPAVVPGVAKTGPLRIKLGFSEPMDPDFIQVQLRFSDGSIQDISSNGRWDSQVLPNDRWTNTTTLPSNAPDGKVIVAVRARKIPCGSAQDTTNQELDTTGSGSSTIPSWDISVDFDFSSVVSVHTFFNHTSIRI